MYICKIYSLVSFQELYELWKKVELRGGTGAICQECLRKATRLRGTEDIRSIYLIIFHHLLALFNCAYTCTNKTGVCANLMPRRKTLSSQASRTETTIFMPMFQLKLKSSCYIHKVTASWCS